MSNVRIQRLVKHDLLAYGKFLLCFLGFIVGAIAVNWILHLFFGVGSFQVNIGSVDIDIQAGDVLLEGFFNMITFSVIGFMMFVSGCVTGYELPQYVRRGIARGEYFIVAMITVAIVSLLIAPIVFVIGTISNFLVPTGSIFYGAFYISSSGLLELGVQFLLYIGFFLTGFFIATVWQRIGWIMGAILTVGILLLFGFLGFLSMRFILPPLYIFDVFNVARVGEYWFEFQWDMAANGTLTMLALVMIMVFGIGTRLLIKNVNVKVR